MDDALDAGDPVKTEVLEQHRQLDAILEEFREALRKADPSTRGAFSLLREALETHFEQEDRLYYPTICHLRPTQKPALQACIQAHDGLRSMLRDISGLLERRELELAAQAFELLAGEFETHEAAEEAALDDLDREVADTRGVAQVDPTPS